MSFRHSAELSGTLGKGVGMARNGQTNCPRNKKPANTNEIKYPIPAKVAGKKWAKRRVILIRVTKTLIEQIDNLSAISTEFSNFAQIPTARNQVFNLADQIKKVIDLFETHDRANISFQID